MLLLKLLARATGEQLSSCVYLELVLSNDVLVDQLISVLLQDDRLVANLLVHDGLREHWLVVLVMSITSIAHLSVVYTTCIGSLALTSYDMTADMI